MENPSYTTGDTTTRLILWMRMFVSIAMVRMQVLVMLMIHHIVSIVVNPGINQNGIIIKFKILLLNFR